MGNVQQRFSFTYKSVFESAKLLLQNNIEDKQNANVKHTAWMPENFIIMLKQVKFCLLEFDGHKTDKKRIPIMAPK